LILAVRDHPDLDRHNATLSRNLRLAALRAFLKFAGRRDVTSLHVVEQASARCGTLPVVETRASLRLDPTLRGRRGRVAPQRGRS
jgi:hypothetical protein